MVGYDPISGIEINTGTGRLTSSRWLGLCCQPSAESS